MQKEQMHPLVSIIVPSFQQGRFLNGCIESILEQDYRPLEIIVVDGASSDETIEVLQSLSHVPELRWISEPDDGPADAVNKGLALAQGEIVGIQSVDDYYLPGAVSAAQGQFQARQELGIVYGEVAKLGFNGQSLGVSKRPPFSVESCIALCVCIPQSSAFFRPQLARSLGGWRKEYFTCDWDLWLRMMFRTSILKVDDVWSVRRLYPAQRTAQRQVVLDSFLRMIDDSSDIRSAGTSVRRAAWASRHVARYIFGDGLSFVQRANSLLLALCVMPRLMPYLPVGPRIWWAMWKKRR